MKILVDEMPVWSGECLFAEPVSYGHQWTDICKITQRECDLHYNVVQNYIKYLR